jgi:hypothetical protein
MAPRKATLATLHDFYLYEPETGYFYRRERMVRLLAIGNHGYRVLTIDGVQYLQHRLAWFYMTGEWPDEIDHDNRDQLDNRWDNLIDRGRSGNSLNKDPRWDNTSGATGVTLERGVWRVRVQGKHIGVYDTFDEAASVANQTRSNLLTAMRKENSNGDRL